MYTINLKATTRITKQRASKLITEIKNHTKYSVYPKEDRKKKKRSQRTDGTKRKRNQQKGQIEKKNKIIDSNPDTSVNTPVKRQRS